MRELNTTKEALKSPYWLAAMQEEICVLHTNKTKNFVPKSPGMNLDGSKWVFKTKLKVDRTIDRYKSRLVGMGFSQLEGLDFEEIFSYVVKATTIKVVLSIVVSSKWEVRQLDVRNIFFHGFLQEEVYMSQPLGFIDP